MAFVHLQGWTQRAPSNPHLVRLLSSLAPAARPSLLRALGGRLKNAMGTLQGGKIKSLLRGVRGRPGGGLGRSSGARTDEEDGIARVIMVSLAWLEGPNR